MIIADNIVATNKVYSFKRFSMLICKGYKSKYFNKYVLFKNNYRVWIYYSSAELCNVLKLTYNFSIFILFVKYKQDW